VVRILTHKISSTNWRKGLFYIIYVVVLPNYFWFYCN
jgi:hypothetical protein